jgi:cytosolic prostaglandin-E synthase
VGVRSIFCIVEKAEAKWWKKLVRDDQRAPHFVKVDWDKWVDEDDDGMRCALLSLLDIWIV